MKLGKITPHKIAIYLSPRSLELILFNETTRMLETDVTMFRTSEYMLFAFEQCFIKLGYL